MDIVTDDMISPVIARSTREAFGALPDLIPTSRLRGLFTALPVRLAFATGLLATATGTAVALMLGAGL